MEQVYQHHIFVCIQQKNADKKCCSQAGSSAIADYLKQQLIARGMHGPGKIRVSQSQCLGRCKKGPNLLIYPEGVWYTFAAEADIDEIIEGHFVQGKVVNRLLNP